MFAKGTYIARDEPGRPTTTAAPGEANTNGAIAELTDEGRSCLRTSGTANLVIDCSGWWI